MADLTKGAKAPKKGAKAPVATAVSIFKELGNVEFFTDYKLMFIVPSLHGFKLIVRKGTNSFAVYCYPEAVESAKCVAGDTISMIAEERLGTDGKLYWNCTGIAKQ